MANDHISATTNVYDSIADSYAKNIEDYVVTSDRDLFLSYIPHNGKILDLGCAAGRDCRYFASKGFDVVGVDLSKKLLAIAKRNAPKLDFRCQDIRRLRFPKHSFDGIYASAVLLHLQRQEIIPTLKKLYTLLKPGGVIFIQVKEGIGEADVAEALSVHQGRHFTYFQAAELGEMVATAKFILKNIYTRNEKDINPKWRDLVWITLVAARS